eukprot:gene5990-34659_t
MKAFSGTTAELCRRVAASFPSPISYGFAYGSAVALQDGTAAGKMIDFVFAVDDPMVWHAANIKQNRDHYSIIAAGGPSAVSQVASMGVGVYYNTLVEHELGCTIKYGVVSTNDLVTDLRDWTHLYLAGRLHKPVLAVTPGGGGGAGSASAIEASLAANHAAAARSAALLLPETFTELDFYTAICGLSYAGDFRMVVGENKNKVQNIVAGQIDLLKPLYAPHIEEMSSWVGDRNGSGSSSSGSGSSSGGEDGGGGRIFAHEQLAEDEVWAAELATKGIYGEQIMQGLTSIVGGSSKTQSAVGILSAGLLKS